MRVQLKSSSAKLSKKFLPLLLTSVLLVAGQVSTPADAVNSATVSAVDNIASLVIPHPTATAQIRAALVSYRAPKNATGLTYRVRYSSNKGKSWVTYPTTTSALSLLVSNLTAAVSYIFEVSAKKNAAWGAWSDDTNAVKPMGGAPTSYTITSSSFGRRCGSPSWLHQRGNWRKSDFQPHR
jgi:hypothetical protein